MEEVGYIIGESTTLYATALVTPKARMGSYVILEYDDKKVLALITSVTRGSRIIGGDFSDLDALKRITAFSGEDAEYVRASLKLLADLTSPSLEQPDLPPKPGTKVRLAGEEELSPIFSSGEIEVGQIVRTKVPVRLSLNYLATRHLAILAATGSGKSNTVAVIASEVAKNGGVILVFDFHGEYVGSDLKPVNVIEPRLNPYKLSADELAAMMDIRENASTQLRILRKVYKEAMKKAKETEDKSSFTQLLIDTASQVNGTKEDKKALNSVILKLEDFERRYSRVLSWEAKDVVENLSLGKVNVVDLQRLDESVMDALISHYLRRILEERKRAKRGDGGLGYPVICVIEEAHVFIPKEERTLTKYWASRVAKEGRKFGVSLFIVSQRPKGLDENILSQMTNKIVMKIVEPKDKAYILESSDNLSEDLVEQLPSLNVGQAIIVGKVVKIPAVTQIKKFQGELGGADPDVISEWKRASEESSRRMEIGRDLMEIG